MIDFREARLEIFHQTRQHTYSCIMHGGSWVFGFRNCKCDSGNKKQYLSDITLADKVEGKETVQ